ncbi:MAG: hypothetical protein ACJ8G1_12620 [Vitreoscilla sp.]
MTDTERLVETEVQRNPVYVSVQTYRQRVAIKRYAQRWPRVTIVDC